MRPRAGLAGGHALGEFAAGAASARADKSMPLIFDDDGARSREDPRPDDGAGWDRRRRAPCRTDDMPSGGSERLADIAPAAAADARAFHDRADRRVFGWTWAWTAAACREDESTRAASTNWRAWALAAERAWLQVSATRAVRRTICSPCQRSRANTLAGVAARSASETCGGASMPAARIPARRF